MKRIFENKHWTIDEREAGGVLVLSRTSEPFATGGDVTRAFDEVLTALAPYRPVGRPLLVDLRAVRGRDDAEYERAAAREPEEIAKRFVRVALLIRTAVGELQLRRTLKGIARRMVVFTDEAQALAHLSASPPRI
jgi:hypothetical protein